LSDAARGVCPPVPLGVARSLARDTPGVLVIGRVSFEHGETAEETDLVAVGLCVEVATQDWRHRVAGVPEALDRVEVPAGLFDVLVDGHDLSAAVMGTCGGGAR
jgi:hypothetical protein